jgi:WS/DGAT/MGAT family acyltransferase
MFVLETDERPFNVGPLVVLKPPAGFRGNFADKLFERMLKRPLGAPFHYRLNAPPIGIPALEVDPNADLSQHVHRMTLKGSGSKKAGSMEHLCATVCKLHKTRLDRSRMLWEFYIIDGLADGHVALYGKVHHGIIDGRTFVKVMSNWLSESPTDRTVRAMWEEVPRTQSAGRGRVELAEQIGRALKGTAGTAASILGLARMIGEQTLRTLGLGGGTSLPFLEVPGAFHGRPSAQRSLAFCTLSLPELKAVGKANDATVNDMLLTVIDMAMTRQLRERGQVPDKALVADMPLALEGAGGGNQITILQLSLGEPGLPPAERLAAIKKSAAALKGLLKRESAESVMLYTTLVHAIPALADRLGLKPGLKLSNLVMSNPFGLPQQRYLMGAQVEIALPVSAVAPGMMLNVTAVTQGELLQIAFLAMPDAVPQVEKLAAYTVDAFAELKHALAPKAVIKSRATAHKGSGSRRPSNAARR